MTHCTSLCKQTVGNVFFMCRKNVPHTGINHTKAVCKSFLFSKKKKKPHERWPWSAKKKCKIKHNFVKRHLLWRLFSYFFGLFVETMENVEYFNWTSGSANNSGARYLDQAKGGGQFLWFIYQVLFSLWTMRFLLLWFACNIRCCFGNDEEQQRKNAGTFLCALVTCNVILQFGHWVTGFDYLILLFFVIFDVSITWSTQQNIRADYSTCQCSTGHWPAGGGGACGVQVSF